MTRVHVSALRRVAVLALLLVSALSCGDDRAGGVTGPPEQLIGFPWFPPPPPPPSNLLVCPTDESQFTAGIFGVLGGILELDGTSITIPNGALSVSTLLTLAIPRSEFMEIRVRANWLESFLFNQPVAITIDYSRCADSALEGKTLKVWQINPFTNQFIEDMGGVDDRAARKITFETGHLSTYAIAF